MDDWLNSLRAALLVSLRIAPVLAFAQPFTLVRIPIMVRVLLGLALALWLVDARPALTTERLAGRAILPVMAGELAIGASIAFAMQATFGAILWAGRALDVQAGFGLAALADPTTREELPLAGTVLAYAAAALFFTTGAQYDLLALWVASIEQLPLGFGVLQFDLGAVAAFLGSVFFLAVGLVGASILVVILTDFVIAFLSRTLPQMNVLLLGFQVKVLVFLVTLPLSLAISGALFLRLIRLALTAPANWWTIR